jgi:hypothetical protein
VTALPHVAGRVGVDVDRVDMLSGVEAEAVSKVAVKVAVADYSNNYFVRNDIRRLLTYVVCADAVARASFIGPGALVRLCFISKLGMAGSWVMKSNTSLTCTLPSRSWLATV